MISANDLCEPSVGHGSYYLDFDSACLYYHGHISNFWNDDKDFKIAYQWSVYIVMLNLFEIVKS